MVEISHKLLKIKTLNSKNLNDSEALDNFIEELSKILETHIVDMSNHTFSPSGYTSYALLQESHAAIHTWPEDNFCVLDILSCKKFSEYFDEDLENLVKSTFTVDEIIVEL